MQFLKKITFKKIMHAVHWTCMLSMLFMSAGMALAAAGTGTTFVGILSSFGQHIWSGFQALGSGVAGLMTASGNALGLVGADTLSQSFIAAAQNAAPALAADPALHAGHAMMGHGMHHAAAAVPHAAAPAFSMAGGPVLPDFSAGGMEMAVPPGPAVTRLEWFQRLAPDMQAQFTRSAEMMGMTLEQYTKDMCGLPALWR